ncbi:MAG: hypothetical protein ORN49_13000, partial [Rhodobacteraceae bacterium]|nr:hypothetical protein [Paracoccaceae bacterium]
GLIMAGLFVKIFMDFGALTGSEGVLSWALPALVPVFGVIGYLLASGLASRDPARFANMGNTKV